MRTDRSTPTAEKSKPPIPPINLRNLREESAVSRSTLFTFPEILTELESAS
jgi:hypothetical protein